MENKKVLLNNKKGKESANKENRLTIDITNNTKLIPTDKIEKVIDEYKQYLKEKKESRKYRLTFDISPYCSNVLFNHLSEIVYKEGAPDCQCSNYKIFNDKLDNVKEYLTYKGMGDKNTLTREDMIMDTGFTHPEIGPFVYHCGYDIFNNHTLRKKEFGVINKMKDNTDNEYRRKFNTIEDYKRYHYGDIVDENVLQRSNNLLYKKNRKIHQYQVSNLLLFSESINENLIEQDGWIGFINPSTIDIDNYVTENRSISLNKCMNNNKSNEFIDMYPDRSLYYFLPKVNKYRNRREYNWDYCLTFPYRNLYEHDLVQYTNKEAGIVVNGLKAVLIDKEIDSFEENGVKILTYEIEEGEVLFFKTILRHNFHPNALVSFSFIGEKNGVLETLNTSTFYAINDCGYYGEDYEHYFRLTADEVIDVLNVFDDPSKVEIRVRQISNGGVCKYYIREFKKIPKLSINDIAVNKNNYNDIIDTIKNCEFNSSLNKMGFSKTIYGDPIAQLIFNDDIDLELLRDNLGRSLSEIYLTIIKNNKGYKEWYNSKNYGSENITFSHCFGEVTSGIDIEDEEIFDYNIHKIHNLDTNLGHLGEVSSNPNEIITYPPFKHLFIEKDGKLRRPEVLEKNITNDNDIFFGDIVEFSANGLNETVLEKVYHRFNTAQREYSKGDEFANLFYDEIIYDDYDVHGGGFEVIRKKYNAYYLNDDRPSEESFCFPANIAPEGYYYQAHYKIPLRGYRENVNEGAHTRMDVYYFESKNNNIYEIETIKNYFMEVNNNFFIYDKITGDNYKAKVLKVGGYDYTTVEFECKNLIVNDNYYLEERYILYKPNVEKPEHAFELNDGTGRYVWRDELEDIEYRDTEIGEYTFTNGSHYINKKINFHLRRQDPDGKYRLSNDSNGIPYFGRMTIDGYSVDYGGVKSINPDEYKMC